MKGICKHCKNYSECQKISAIGGEVRYDSTYCQYHKEMNENLKKSKGGII